MKLQTIICSQKTSMEKKIPNKVILQQKVYKTTIEFICIGHLLLGRVPTLSVVNIISETPLKETILFQTCVIGDSFTSTFPLSALRPQLAWTCAGPCVLPVFVRLYASAWHDSTWVCACVHGNLTSVMPGIFFSCFPLQHSDRLSLNFELANSVRVT